MKYFTIEFYKKEKYGDPIIRRIQIKSTDMKSAIFAYRKTIGSLKYNPINYVQETKPDGTPIGERMVPKKIENVEDYTFTKAVL